MELEYGAMGKECGTIAEVWCYELRVTAPGHVALGCYGGSGMLLREVLGCCYERCGTELANAATLYPAPRCYALCGTALAYAATLSV
eukprot:1590320-Rhodomonas_salina.3